jgi:hypothetical protein
VIAGAELLIDGLLASAARLGVPAFTLTVVLSGFELENLPAGIAANAKGLPGAAAGTFLGGTSFLAIGVAGIGALIAPIRAQLAPAALAWTEAAPLPILLLSLGGTLSRVDGAVLILWFGVAIFGLARFGRALLADGLAGGDGDPQVLAGLDLALDFHTWRSLLRHSGLGQRHAVEVVVATLACLRAGAGQAR